MPIYEFRCSGCREEFEALVFGTDEGIVCPHCNGDKLERLMSACSFKNSEGYSPASGSPGCSSCTSTNCSSCH